MNKLIYYFDFMNPETPTTSTDSKLWLEDILENNSYCGGKLFYKTYEESEKYRIITAKKNIKDLMEKLEVLIKSLNPGSKL